MLPEVDKVLEPGSDLKDMSPEEQAFYTDPSSVERAEWQKEQNKIVRVTILQLNIWAVAYQQVIGSLTLNPPTWL